MSKAATPDEVGMKGAPYSTWAPESVPVAYHPAELDLTSIFFSKTYEHLLPSPQA